MYDALIPVGLVDVDIIAGSSGELFVIDVNPRFGGGYPFNHIAGANVPRMYLRGLTQGDTNSSDLDYTLGVVGGKHESIKLVGTTATSPQAGDAHE